MNRGCYDVCIRVSSSNWKGRIREWIQTSSNGWGLGVNKEGGVKMLPTENNFGSLGLIFWPNTAGGGGGGGSSLLDPSPGSAKLPLPLSLYITLFKLSI